MNSKKKNLLFLFVRNYSILFYTWSFRYYSEEILVDMVSWDTVTTHYPSKFVCARIFQKTCDWYQYM